MTIDVLNPERLAYWCSRLKMPAGAFEALAQVAAEVCASPELLSIFSAVHEATALRGEWHTDWSPVPFDPRAQETFNERTSLFYLLAYMAALPYAEKEYQRLGIGADIFDATLYDITFYTLQATDVHGYWRFDQLMWIWRHLSVKLFRLGRLQFMLIPYHGHATAFRHRQSGEIVLLCGPEIPLRADGWAQGAGGGSNEPDENTWFAEYEESAQGWRGNPISPYGRAMRDPISLPAADWEKILSQGDTVLDLHIPRGKTLTAQECRDSFQQAYDFFARLWPDRPFKASFCHTWFFTPQLQTLLPATSSIVNFQREFYLYPNAGGPGFLWSFVFGEKYPDRATAPRDTSLRRAVLDWMEEGKALFDLPGVRFHPPEDWGSQVYMRAWDQKTAE